MAQQHDKQDRLGRAMLGMLCAALCLPTVALADGDGADGVGPSDEIIQGAPSVLGFVNDGDETVVETVMLYMNGCPLVSVTPPEGGRGMPVVTSIEQDGDCVAGRGTQDPAILEARGDSGMHVQLWTNTDDDADGDASKALVIEVSSLYPDALPDATETMAAGSVPAFFIPGVFGDPSGDLTLASADGGGGGGSIWGGLTGGTGAGGGFGGGTGGAGGNTPVPGGGFLNTTPGVGGGGSAPATPPIAAVPLPATLLLLLWALQFLRSYVRRS